MPQGGVLRRNTNKITTGGWSCYRLRLQVPIQNSTRRPGGTSPPPPPPRLFFSSLSFSLAAEEAALIFDKPSPSERNMASYTDVVIVGAGLSGLISALNLLEHHGVASNMITIVEGRSRVGGRLKAEQSESGNWILPELTDNELF